MVEPKYYLETDASVRPGERHRSGDRPSVGGAGLVLWDPELRMVLAESVPLGPVSCGPEAELRAVLVGLRRAKALKVERLRIRSDCLPVVRHLSGVEELETQWAARLKEEIGELLRSFTFVEAHWTPSSHAIERRAGVPTPDYLARRAVGLGPRRVRRRPPHGSGWVGGRCSTSEQEQGRTGMGRLMRR
jgi:ribonuclease HI